MSENPTPAAPAEDAGGVRRSPPSRAGRARRERGRRARPVAARRRSRACAVAEPAPGADPPEPTRTGARARRPPAPRRCRRRPSSSRPSRTPRRRQRRRRPPPPRPRRSVPASDPAAWGRVAEDGTVFVRTADGERAVGSYPGAEPPGGAGLLRPQVRRAGRPGRPARAAGQLRRRLGQGRRHDA